MRPQRQNGRTNPNYLAYKLSRGTESQIPRSATSRGSVGGHGFPPRQRHPAASSPTKSMPQEGHGQRHGQSLNPG
jgi:hypothetical protein